MSTRPSASSRPRSFALVLGLGALLLGCSGDTSGSQACGSNASCLVTGQECNLQTGYCATVCDQTLCKASSECSSHYGECTPVHCGYVVTCADSGDFCDPAAHECYPSSGKCSFPTDCPLFDGRLSKAATVACQGGFCRVSSAPPMISFSGLSGRAAPLQVSSPSFGAKAATPDALRFQWDGSAGNTSVALVLTDLPQELSQVLTTAVWGRVLPAEAEPVASWQDGVAIQNGVWRDSSPAVPSGPLYFLVQAVRGGKLVAMSAPVPFRVGSDWPALSSRCSDNDILPGSCANPARPQICRSGSCRHLCASHLDCSAEGTLCEAPVNGVRICG